MTLENKSQPIFSPEAKQVDSEPLVIFNKPETIRYDRFGRKPTIAELAATLSADQLEQLQYGTLDLPAFIKRPTKKSSP